MTQGTVLVTGANGHLGFRVLVSALKAGHTVRATVRSSEASRKILNAASIEPYRAKLEIMLVKDILEDGAFDQAVVGMDFVLHIASPVSRPSDNYQDDFIKPAVQGTLGLLKSASKTSSVKRVVITSSIAVLDVGKQGRVSVHDIGPIPPLDELSSPFAAYTASKRVALRETTKFIEQNSPNFDVIHILPSVILGRNELVETVSDLGSSTNRYAISVARGINNTAPMLGASVFVNDCAELHVLALNPAVKGNQSFIASGGAVVWNDVNEIVKSDFSESIEMGLFKSGGNLSTNPLNLDTEATAKVFGVKWVPFEEQVKNVLEHYLEVLKREG